MKKKVALYDKDPITFEAGQVHITGRMDGTLNSIDIHIISVVQDEYVLPKEGTFTDTVVTYRWFSDYKGYWLYDVNTDRSLSFKIRHHKKMMTAFKRSKKEE